MQATYHHLKILKYHIQATTRLSDKYYSHTNTYEIYGTGQGSRFSGALHVFESDPVISTLEKYCDGYNMSSHDHSIE